MAQQNAGAVFGPEFRDSTFDFPAQLLVFHLLQLVLPPFSDLERGGFDHLGRFGVGRALEREGVELAAAEVIDGGVVRDLEDPGRELVFRPVAVQRIQHLDESFLGEVLREFPVPHHPENQ